MPAPENHTQGIIWFCGETKTKTRELLFIVVVVVMLNNMTTNKQFLQKLVLLKSKFDKYKTRNGKLHLAPKRNFE